MCSLKPSGAEMNRLVGSSGMAVEIRCICHDWIYSLQPISQATTKARIKSSLIASSLGDYESLAHALATDPARLIELRQKLERNRTSHPLFDTDRFRRHIEAAYATMWDIWQRGESPPSFSVATIES